MQKGQYQNGLAGLAVALGLVIMGAILAKAAVGVKELERTVTVKGLSEQEFVADVVIWPIQYSVASNDLTDLYLQLEESNNKILNFLTERGLPNEAITLSAPNIVDKSAQQYGGYEQALFRYSGSQTVTVYSSEIELVREMQSSLSELGRQGIVFTSRDYGVTTEYLFTRLNDVKPDMVEEATRNARQVAEKFAEDSDSQLGKIKRASQGQFSITARDRNNPHIKRVRVVSTIEYYLSD